MWMKLTSPLIANKESLHIKQSLEQKKFRAHNVQPTERFTEAKLAYNRLVLCFSPGVSNSVSYAGHILTKKGSRAALREKMSQQAAIGG